jgi:magnesium transporter
MWTSPSKAPGRPHQSAIVDCGLYVGGVRQSGRTSYADALAEARARGDGFVWLGLHEPSPAEMAEVAEAFGLHELAVEDALQPGQRPKLEQTGAADVSVLVLRAARYVDHAELTETSEVVETGDLILLIGERFVISVRHGPIGPLSPVRAELETKPNLLRLGPWAVAYAVTDHVVDRYLEVIDRVERDIDALEESAFSRHARGGVQRIYQLKRELVEFRRCASPLQRPLATLAAEDAEIPPKLRRYFRDALEHLTRTVEQVTSFDELLNSILAARLAQVTVDQNNDLRKIAAWAAIAASQTLIAGIYGMNFRFMPELQMTYGYPVVLALMVLSALALYRLFRRSGWL